MRLAAVWVLLMPFAALASGPGPDADWHRCTTDADCVLVEGMCGKASVTRGFEREATRYYAAQASKAKCKDEFWKPTDVVARCHLESCDAIGKN